MEIKAKFQVSGKIIEVGEEQVFSSGFVKREVIIETTRNEAYPSPVKVTFKKDDCAKCNTLHIGDGVDVEGFVEGRKWEKDGRVSYFIDLKATSIQVVEKAEAPTTATDWNSFVLLGQAYGKTKDEMAEIGKAYCEANKKTFKALKAEDWNRLAAEFIEKMDGVAKPEEPDFGDMPF